MRHHRPHLTKFFSMLAIGLAMTAVGCDDQNQASDNLLTNPGAAKYSISPANDALPSGDETPRLREMTSNNYQQLDDKAPARPWEVFHEKLPKYTNYFLMQHDGTNTVYKDGSGVEWYHIPAGDWASKYSPNPGALPPPTITYHIASGPDATRYVTLWHIPQGGFASQYYDPRSDTAWAHVPSGLNASLYAISTTTSSDVPDDPGDSDGGN